MSQPFLIERLINFLKKDFDTEPKEKERITPAGKPLLHADSDGLPRKHTWYYRTAVGMAGYLQGNTRPDISIAVHQCARFVNNPMRINEKSMYKIFKYLISKKDCGIIYSPDPSLGLECFVDAYFAGGWSQADADNAENVISRTGFFLRYDGCAIGRRNKLQTEILLIKAEA